MTTFLTHSVTILATLSLGLACQVKSSVTPQPIPPINDTNPQTESNLAIGEEVAHTFTLQQDNFGAWAVLNSYKYEYRGKFSLVNSQDLTLIPEEISWMCEGEASEANASYFIIDLTHNITVVAGEFGSEASNDTMTLDPADYEIVISFNAQSPCQVQTRFLLEAQ